MSIISTINHNIIQAIMRAKVIYQTQYFLLLKQWFQSAYYNSLSNWVGYIPEKYLFIGYLNGWKLCNGGILAHSRLSSHIATALPITHGCSNEQRRFFVILKSFIDNRFYFHSLLDANLYAIFELSSFTSIEVINTAEISCDALIQF